MSGRRRKKKKVNIFIWCVAFLVFSLDQISKLFVSQNIVLNQPNEIIKNVFYLTLVHNTGAAFGIFKNQTLFFVIVSILAVAIIVVYMKKRPKVFSASDVALALILGGALGNLADRLRLGYVVDFLDFRIWPVFNIADSAITVGVFLLIISLLPRKRDTLLRRGYGGQVK